MDIQKEREAFEAWHYEQYLLENPNIDISNARYIYDYAHKNAFVCQLKESHFTAWQASKAQAVPEGYVMVPKCLYCNGYGEVGCRFEGTFTCPECNGDRINLKAVIEAQEST